MRDSDEQWRDCEGSWDRLRWARLRWQRRANAVACSAEAAAESLGVKPGTYRQYERRPDSSRSATLEAQNAAAWGRRFGVSWTWLLNGEGTPFDGQLDGNLPDTQARVLKAMAVASEEQQQRLADLVEAFLKTGT